MTLWTVQVLFLVWMKSLLLTMMMPLPSETLLVRNGDFWYYQHQDPGHQLPGGKPMGYREQSQVLEETPPMDSGGNRFPCSSCLSADWTTTKVWVWSPKGPTTIAGSMTTMRFNLLKCPIKSHLSGCSEEGPFYFKPFLLLGIHQQMPVTAWAAGLLKLECLQT